VPLDARDASFQIVHSAVDRFGHASVPVEPRSPTKLACTNMIVNPLRRGISSPSPPPGVRLHSRIGGGMRPRATHVSPAGGGDYVENSGCSGAGFLTS
jgi:hypothetical protein